ncbi:4'-phosphopantetheinyl transferase family protein [Brachybacterium sp. DNPG3]
MSRTPEGPAGGTIVGPADGTVDGMIDGTADGATWAWHPVETDADDALRHRVALLLAGAGAGVSVGAAAGDRALDTSAIRVGRLCPSCGSSAHGRPWARVAGHAGTIGVSVSRAGSHLLTAVRIGGEIGADVEGIRAVADRWDPSLVLHPSEAAATALDQARAWTRKEAILKLLGTGLRTPMPEIRIADHRVLDIPAPAGVVAALAMRPTGPLSPS